MGTNNADRTPVDIKLTVVMPDCVAGLALVPSDGSVTYDPATRMLTWKVSKLSPLKPALSLSGNIDYKAGAKKPLTSPNVLLECRVRLFNASGLRVASLSCANEPYSPFKGIRGSSLCKAEIRC